MDKFAVDYNSLKEELKPKEKVFKYAEVEHRLEKVAWDVVRFVDPDESVKGLWQIKKTDDGEVIVATYSSEPDELSNKVSCDWSVIPDSTGHVSVFYKSTPVVKLALKDFDIPLEDVTLAAELISTKLASDSSMKDSLLAELSHAARTNLLANHPELEG